MAKSRSVVIPALTGNAIHQSTPRLGAQIKTRATHPSVIFRSFRADPSPSLRSFDHIRLLGETMGLLHEGYEFIPIRFHDDPSSMTPQAGVMSGRIRRPSASSAYASVARL